MDRVEIREGLRYFVQGDCAYFGEKECPFENNLACQECDERIHELLSYLHSQGLVLKVEGELPSVFDYNEDVMSAVEYKKKLVSCGFFESLIGDE